MRRQALKTCIWAFLFCLLLAGDALSRKMEHRELPKIVLWAWERPEDLRFIDPRKVAVAYLARSFTLSGGDVFIRNRFQPLQIPDHTPLIAVVRISTSRQTIPTLSDAQIQVLTKRILDISSIHNIRGIQIDFDAMMSERAFYRRLLTELRTKLADSLTLSITALASWCLYDTWIRDLPVDEAVPMMFRLGPDRSRMLKQFAKGEGFTLPLCRESIGISTDEPLPSVPTDRRIYVFSPDSWSDESLKTLLKVLNR